MKIKCSCGNPNCKISIYFGDKHLWFIDKDGKETPMYLNKKSINELISALKTIEQHENTMSV